MMGLQNTTTIHSQIGEGAVYSLPFSMLLHKCVTKYRIIQGLGLVQTALTESRRIPFSWVNKGVSIEKNQLTGTPTNRVKSNEWKEKERETRH